MGRQIYLFSGDDAYALKEARHKLERELLDPAWRDFNLTVLSADAPGGKIVEALLALPFGPGNRLCVIPSPGWLSAKVEDDALAAFEALLDSGLPSRSYLLLLAPKPDSRLKLVKKLQGLAVLREFAAPKPWQVEEALGPWVERKIKEEGRALAPDALRALMQASGGDRARLGNELEKLFVGVPPGAPITLQDVRALSSAGDVQVFALTDALAARRAPEALGALRRLLTNEPALKVLAAVVTIVRGWGRIKRLHEEGAPPQAIAQAIGARSDFKVRKDLETLKPWKAAEIERALGVLLSLDLALKSGRWPAELQPLAWEKAIADLLMR